MFGRSFNLSFICLTFDFNNIPYHAGECNGAVRSVPRGSSYVGGLVSEVVWVAQFVMDWSDRLSVRTSVSV